ncbi:hypothetical protein SESBI_37890 [Sesbania bispinosa]|nr:hypothetical protein SESBI_37890 [Sesbania bispinosa]
MQNAPTVVVSPSCHSPPDPDLQQLPWSRAQQMLPPPQQLRRSATSRRKKRRTRTDLQLHTRGIVHTGRRRIFHTQKGGEQRLTCTPEVKAWKLRCGCDEASAATMKFSAAAVKFRDARFLHSQFYSAVPKGRSD